MAELYQGSGSPGTRLDDALSHLLKISDCPAFPSSQSSPLTSDSSGVISPVVDDIMTDTIGISSGTRVGYSGLLGESYSPGSSGYSSTGRKQTYRTISTDSRDTKGSSSSSYGMHIIPQQQMGASDGFYKVKPSADKVITSQHHHSQSGGSREVNGTMSQSLTSPSQQPLNKNLYRRVDSRQWESPSPESPLSPQSSLDRSDTYSRSRNLVTKTTKTITSSNILPVTGENESLTISPEAIKQIKQHTEDSNRLIAELQEQLQLIPQMQERIRRLKEDKKSLAYQLQVKSGVSSMRSIGVGDYDVDEDHVRVERIKQTVTQEAVKPPTRGVGVGVYDVNTELYTQADVIHTVAEHVQKVREREIQSWIQEAEAVHNARKASTRSFGVGDKNVWEEDNRLIKEKEMKTILIEQSKPSQRNVGLQVKPSMRDVCIEYSRQDTKPLTRTCGVNVDISDIMQEMSSQSAENLGSSSQQQNSWTLQKHVIQRKFMEAMTTGRQEDLVNFITGLLKRSVRSVGVTAKPITADHGMTTRTSTCDRGVSNDVVDVIVKPYVQTKEAFTLAKPATRTQPTWTDLILTCDAGTNTQKYLTDKSVNTSAPQKQIENEQTTTKTLQTYNRPHRDLNRTITETTVTEHRTSRSVPEVEQKYHSHIDKMMAPPPKPVELDIALPKQLTASERNQLSEQSLHESHTEEQHRTEVHMMLPGNTESLSPLKVKISPHGQENKAEIIAATTHTLLAQGSSLYSPTSPSSGVVNIKLSPSRSKSLTREFAHSTNISLGSRRRGGYVRSRSLSEDRHHKRREPLIPSNSSTKRVISEQTPYSTMKESTELSESGDTLKKETVIERTFSTGRAATSHSANMLDNTGIDTKSTSLSDFDYFGRSYSGQKPKGHAERMERYSGSMKYNSTNPDVDEVRNITELHGNPLKSRYTIEEMSSEGTSGPYTRGISEPRTKSKSLLKDRDSPRIRRTSGVKFADQVSDQSPLGVEFDEACVVVQKFLEDGGTRETPQLAAAREVIQSKWFSVSSSPSSDAEAVNNIIFYITRTFNRTLLSYVINMVDGNGNSTLHYSVSNCNFEVMRVLLKTGLANADVLNKAGYTPVMLAALCDVSSDEVKKALRLLLLNADVNVTASQAGQTALMLAVAHNKQEMVNLLLEAKSDVNTQDQDGSTALMCAAEHNHVDIIKTLLSHPDINVLLKDQDGSTALDIALESGNEEIAELLDMQEKTALSTRSTGRRSVSASIPSKQRADKSQRDSSYSSSSSRSYTSRFV